MTLHRTFLLALLLALALGARLACAQEVPGCGDLRDSTGPFDYRTVEPKTRALVESYHFTVGVEKLFAGHTGKIGGDLDYTLRAMPNHHRALISMMTYGQRLKLPHVPAAKFSVECYFKRALQFAADDTIARLLYATYLFRNGRDTEADGQISITIQEAGDNGFSHYNIGMVLAEQGRYDQALQQAHRAAALGFDRPQLREVLVQAGRWQEPAPAAAASAPAAAGSAASSPGEAPQ